ncbi:kinase-like domain-containing protein [Xylariomycetidae sp. FL0641]|nr:kinase-like domain-containing protein [Xylariomycetidae sp. FL0641]
MSSLHDTLLLTSDPVDASSPPDSLFGDPDSQQDLDLDLDLDALDDLSAVSSPSETSSGTPSPNIGNQNLHVDWRRHGLDVHPAWTNLPTIVAVAETLQSAIGRDKTYSINPLWDGHCSKLYHVVFDQQSFVLRVLMPVCPELKTESEVATLAWVRQNTSLPVPGVRAYDSTRGNPLGYEWILMHAVPGRPLSEVWDQVSFGAKQRIVKQLAAFATAVFMKPFTKGIGSIYLSDSRTPHVGEAVHMPFFWGEHTSRHLYRGPFRHASDWIGVRLASARDDLLYATQYLHSDKYLNMIPRMGNIVSRLDDLRDTFFPTECLADDQNQADSDNPADPDKTSPVPTMVWHDNLSLDNIMVDDSGVLCGVLDWQSITCLPIYEACQLPVFLQQSVPRPREPEEQDYMDKATKKIDPSYRHHHRQYQITKLAEDYIYELYQQCRPLWNACNDVANKRLREYDTAVQNCVNEYAYRKVEKWVDDAEEGRGEAGEVESLQRQLMG